METLTFDRNLWPNLAQINTYNKQAVNKMQSFQRFAMSVNILVKKFSDGLRKCTQTLEQDMDKHPIANYDHENDTLSMAFQCVKSGVDTLSQNLDETIHQIIGDLVEPLETFTKLYSQETVDLINQADKQWSYFQEFVRVSNQAKDKYFDLKWDVEKCEIQLEEAMLAHERGQVTTEKVQRISQHGTDTKYKAEVATQKYHDAITNVNKISKNLQKSYCPLLLKIQQSEESRINFFKSSIKKMMRHLATIGTKITSSAQHVQEQSEFVNSDTDLQLFISSQTQVDKPPTDDYLIEVYQSHVDIKKYKQELAARQVLEAVDADDSGDEDGVLVFNDPSEKVKKIIYTLVVDGQPIGPEDTGYMLESCKLPEVRQSLGAFFRGVTAQRVIHKKDCFVVLGWLCLAFIDQLDPLYNEDLHQLEGLIQMSLLVCMQEGNHKVYLSTEIDQHRIWQPQELWSRLLQLVINLKITEAQQKPNAQDQNKDKSLQAQLQYAAGGFKMGFGALKGLAKNLNQNPSTVFSSIQSQIKTTFSQELPQVPQLLQSNIAYNTQSLFIKYFVNYHLSFNHSRDIILLFSKKYDFDKSRTHLLLSELESIQKNQNYLLTPKDRDSISLQRKERHLKKFDNYLIQGLVIPYISDDLTLVQFVRLNKKSNQLLSRTVYKHSLTLCQPERLPHKRLQIWEHLLNLSECTNDYESFKQKVILKPELISNVEEVIMLDVQRSAHSMPCIDIDSLVSLLKTYAYYNPEIEYCQGMNYIAGFLLTLVKDEEAAFKILLQLCEKNRMADLFNPDIPRLKLFFLQLDRMICFANTDLYNHFTNEDITSSYFASAWFITLFTNSLKQNHDAEGKCNESLLQLWDYFMIVGWKAVLKLGLYILTIDQTLLIGKQFEEILTHLVESPKHLLQQERNGVTIYQMMKQEFKRIPVTFHLDRLQSEFDKSHANIPGKNKKM